MSETNTLELRSVSKRYPGMLAVDRVDFDLREGEVHALLGENGAGKSTLVKLIAGSFTDYSGEVVIAGQGVALHSPAASKSFGIEMIHQELSLAQPLSLAENILAGQLPAKMGVIDRSALVSETKRLLAQLGLDLDPDTLVEDISQPEAQLVEIAKALGNKPRILILDEPTSSLSRKEVNRLFDIIRGLRQSGLSLIYISHHLPELREIADRVTVMRDGKKVTTCNISDVTTTELVDMMVGRSISDMYAHRNGSPGDEALRVDGLSRYGFFHDVSFSIRAGEIVGIGGLSGSGRSELARSICRIDPVSAGEIFLNDVLSKAKNYGQATTEGFAYVAEDRKKQGVALRLNVRDNLLSGVIDRFSRGLAYSPQSAGSLPADLISKLEIYPPDPETTVRNLSGGNQQKVLVAKWLATNPKMLILDEPTRGVDVGAKIVIHRAVAEAADRGVAILLISSDLPELVGLSDRVLIIRKGHITGQLDKNNCTEESVLLAANGQGELLPV